MSYLNDEKLSKIMSIVPEEAYGVNANMFVIALEGYRRGLELRMYTKQIKNKRKIRYSLSDGVKTVDFQLSLAEEVPKETRRITRSKKRTKDLLIQNNVNTPKGFNVTDDLTMEDILESSERLNFPLVAKPTNGSLGIGVRTDIKSKDELREAVQKLREKYDDIIVEEQFKGYDVRAFVVNGKFLSAFRRERASVTGDGISTIDQLITQVNNIRKSNPHIADTPIKKDDELKAVLKEQGYNLDSILEKGVKVLLTFSQLVSSTLDTRDVTDILPQEVKDTAEAAAKSLDDLHFTGMDIMVDFETGRHAVLELNSRPTILGSTFIMNGKKRDVPGAIIDFYFPNTEIVHDDQPLIYFDYATITNNLKEGIVDEVVLKHPDIEDFKMKEITLTGDKFSGKINNWILRKAAGHNLIGYVRKYKKEKIKILVGGQENKINKFLEIIDKRSSKKKRFDYSFENVNKPVMNGFYNYNERNKVNKLINRDKKRKTRISELEQHSNKLERELKLREQRIKKLESKINYMENSLSWKFTKIFRSLRSSK